MTQDCQSMEEVRAEIDRIDRLLVPLLLERLVYIEQAGRIKNTRESVRDDDRIEDVISKTLQTARKEGGFEPYIEDVYRFLIEWSINHEFKVWDEYRGK